ncbi:MAG: DUF3095 family protein [Bacteroidota bacterium]
MGEQTHDSFYSSLAVQAMSVSKLVSRMDLFREVPEDWHIIITDVKNSTAAVQNGQQENINLIATGSIIAALNIARKASLEIPFFFGGDGGTMIVPSSLLPQIMQAELIHSQNAMQAFGLQLRVGHVPVNDVYKAGHSLLISRFHITDAYVMPVVLGEGLRYAEEVIKADSYESELPETGQSSLDLEGMQCRWDRIKPPEEQQEVVALLVDVLDSNNQSQVFQSVLSSIDSIYGPGHNRNPISVPRLALKPTLEKLETETLARFGRKNYLYKVYHTLATKLGTLMFRYNKSYKRYLSKMVELADTLVIDGRINTVITGNAIQREKLYQTLLKLEQAGELIFGMHVSQESIMSCYVRDMKDDHIHFVDGSEGGYTRAAKILKQKLRR